jgi:hypothetical protein
MPSSQPSHRNQSDWSPWTGNLDTDPVFGEEEKRKGKEGRLLFMSQVGPLRFYDTRPG